MKEQHPEMLSSSEQEADGVFDFAGLGVYQRALAFIDRVREVTTGSPPEQKYALTDPFGRAAMSIAWSVAERSGGSKAESRRFFRVSRRSVRDCVAVTEISGGRSHISGEVRRELRLWCAGLSRMPTGLIRSLPPNAPHRMTNGSEDCHVAR
jgi:four helix bundle protein